MPKPKKFFYKKSLDKKVGIVAEKVLKLPVSEVKKMGHGDVNHVYKVTTPNKAFLFRIFQYQTWPEAGKLEWIEKQLSSRHIPHAKILYFTRGKEFFPFGFMVMEFLAGLNGSQAVKQKKISFAQTFFRTGKLLKQIHKVRTKNFGPLIGSRSKTDFMAFKLGQAKRRLKRLEKDKAIEPGLYKAIEAKAKQVLAELGHRFSPALNHADAHRDNAILTTKGQWVLVDWDNAYSGAWIEDFTEITFWSDWSRNLSQAKKISAVITKNFFKGYGQPKLSYKQIQSLEKALHLLKTTNMLEYFHFFKRNKPQFNKALRKLRRLLK